MSPTRNNNGAVSRMFRAKVSTTNGDAQLYPKFTAEILDVVVVLTCASGKIMSLRYANIRMKQVNSESIGHCATDEALKVEMSRLTKHISHVCAYA